MKPGQLITDGLAALSLRHSEKQADAFLAYLNELKKWSRAYNLTALKTDRDIVIKHFLDSLLYLEGLPRGAVSLIDVGSGAGFPGIPLKIMRPEISLTLLEPSRKKASFLHQIKSLLRLEKTAVIEKRLEQLRSDLFDIAVTRALFDIRDFILKASPLIKPGGRLILNKGPKVSEELTQIDTIGGHTITVLKRALPFTSNTRFIVVVEKASDSNVEFTPLLRAQKTSSVRQINTCFNTECRLRKAGCSGFAGCPGFKTKDE